MPIHHSVIACIYTAEEIGVMRALYPVSILFAVTIAVAMFGTAAFAHGGGLDSNRCHTDHKTGTYHCH